MQKMMAVGMTAMMCASMLAGCGKENNEQTGTSGKVTDAAAETKAQGGEGTTLTIGFWGSSGEDKAVLAAAEGIQEAVPGVKEIQIEQYPGADDFYQKLPGQIAAGTAPDLIIATNEQHLQLIADGLLVPLG